MNHKLLFKHQLLGLFFGSIGILVAILAASFLPAQLAEHTTTICFSLGLGIPVALDLGYRFTRRESKSFGQRLFSPEMGAHYYFLPLWVCIVGIVTVYFGVNGLPF